MDEPKIQLIDGGIRIDGLEVPSGEVRAFVADAGAPESEWPGRVISALEIGVAALERVTRYQDLDWVGRQLDGLLTEVGQQIDEVPGKVEKELIAKIGDENSGVLQNVHALVTKATGEADRTIEDVRTLITTQLSPTDTTSPLYQSIDSIKQLISGAPGSIQQKIADAVTDVTRVDGALSASVKAVVDNSLKPYTEAIAELMRTITADEAVAKMMETTTRKGDPFEERIYRLLKEAFGPGGCRVERVGGENKKGDILMHFDEAGGKYAVNFRIIVEAKNRPSESWGEKKLANYSEGQMAEWDAIAAVFIAPPEQFANETRYWFEGKATRGSWVATTEEYAVEAVRYLRIMIHLQRRSLVEGVVDMEAAARSLRTIRLQLREIANANTQVTNVHTAADSIKGTLRAMKTAIEASVADAEQALGLRASGDAQSEPEPAPHETAAPVAATKSAAVPAAKVESIVCEVCGETFERPQKRGRKPTRHPWCK